MTPPTPCATIEPRLTAYILGDLPAVEAADVQTHLHDCPACRQSVRELEPTLALLRATLTPNTVTQPRLEKARRDAVYAARRPGVFAWLYHPRPIWLKAAALVAVSAAMLLVWRHPEREKDTLLERDEATTISGSAPATEPLRPLQNLDKGQGSSVGVQGSGTSSSLKAEHRTPNTPLAAEGVLQVAPLPSALNTVAGDAGSEPLVAPAPLATAAPVTTTVPAESRTEAKPKALLPRPGIARDEALVGASATQPTTDRSTGNDGLPQPDAPPIRTVPVHAARTLSLRLGGAETAAALDAAASPAPAPTPAKIVSGSLAQEAATIDRAANRSVATRKANAASSPAELPAEKQGILRVAEPVLPDQEPTRGGTTTTDRNGVGDTVDDDLAPTSVGDSAIAALDLAYPAPAAGRELALHTEISPSPCRPGHRLLLIGVTAGSSIPEPEQANRARTEARRAKDEPELTNAMDPLTPVPPTSALHDLQFRADFSSQRVRHVRVLAVSPAGSPWRVSGGQVLVELGRLGAGGSATALLDLDAAETGTGPLGTVRVWFRNTDKQPPTVGGVVLNREREQPDWDKSSLAFRLAACAAEFALARHEPGTDAAARVETLTAKVQRLTDEAPDNPRVTQLLHWLLTPAESARP